MAPLAQHLVDNGVEVAFTHVVAGKRIVYCVEDADWLVQSDRPSPVDPAFQSARATTCLRTERFDIRLVGMTLARCAPSVHSRCLLDSSVQEATQAEVTDFLRAFPISVRHHGQKSDTQKVDSENTKVAWLGEGGNPWSPAECGS